MNTNLTRSGPEIGLFSGPNLVPSHPHPDGSSATR